MNRYAETDLGWSNILKIVYLNFILPMVNAKLPRRSLLMLAARNVHCLKREFLYSSTTKGTSKSMLYGGTLVLAVLIILFSEIGLAESFPPSVRRFESRKSSRA